MKKNAAQRIVFPILDASGSPVSAAAGLDTEYSLDGGSFGDIADEAHEMATSSGVYYVDLAAGETNGDVVAIQCKTSTANAKTTVLVFYTVTTTIDLMKADTAAIKTMTDKIGTVTNTGGTATIGAILGDFANSALVTRVAAVKTDTAAIKAITDLLTLAAINAEVDTALNTAIPGSPTADSVNERVKATDDKLPTNYIMGSAVQTAKDDEIDAVKAVTDTLTLAAIADAVHDEVTEGTTTLRKAVKLICSALFAKTSGGGSATLVARDIGDTKARITLTVDANGNRTASTLDGV